MPANNRWTAADIPDLRSLVAIVTGGNSGIGFATAHALAKHGATVILACRNAARGQAAAAQIMAGRPLGSSQFMPLDLADLNSVRRFAAQFQAQHHHLHLLVNNAGIMHAPHGQTADGFERHMGINYLGHFALTGLLLPRLIGSAPTAQPIADQNRRVSRVVNVCSLAHLIGRIDLQNLDGQLRYHRIAAYARSKLALLIFTFELQRRLRASRSPLIAVAAHPGWAGTNLHARMPIVRLVNPIFSQTPAAGALPVLLAATDRSVAGGEHYGPGNLLELRGRPGPAYTSRRARDPLLAGRLWRLSQELTGVTYPA